MLYNILKMLGLMAYIKIFPGYTALLVKSILIYYSIYGIIITIDVSNRTGDNLGFKLLLILLLGNVISFNFHIKKYEGVKKRLAIYKNISSIILLILWHIYINQIVDKSLFENNLSNITLTKSIINIFKIMWPLLIVEIAHHFKLKIDKWIYGNELKYEEN